MLNAECCASLICISRVYSKFVCMIKVCIYGKGGLYDKLKSIVIQITELRGLLIAKLKSALKN